MGSPPDRRSSTHSPPPRTCPEPVLCPCPAWSFTSVSRMTTRRPSFPPPAPRESPWKLVCLTPGTSMPPRLLESTDSVSPPRRHRHEGARNEPREPYCGDLHHELSFWCQCYRKYRNHTFVTKKKTPPPKKKKKKKKKS